MTSIFDQHLPRTAANFAPLSPLGFIERTAEAAFTIATSLLDEGLIDEDEASMFRVDVAMGKAWAAVGMGASSRTLLARARGDDAYPALLDRYRDMATSLALEGHIAWAEKLVEY